MVCEIDNIIEFTKKLESECDPNFTAQISGRRVKLFTHSFCVKKKIAVFLKEQNFQFYMSPNTKAPLKIIRGLPKSIQTEAIKRTLNEEGLDIFQATQMRNRKNGRILPLSMLHLPKNEKSQRIFKLTSIFFKLEFKLNIIELRAKPHNALIVNIFSISRRTVIFSLDVLVAALITYL